MKIIKPRFKNLQEKKEYGIYKREIEERIPGDLLKSLFHSEKTYLEQLLFLCFKKTIKFYDIEKDIAAGLVIRFLEGCENFRYLKMAKGKDNDFSSRIRWLYCSLIRKPLKAYQKQGRKRAFDLSEDEIKFLHNVKVK